MKIRISFSDGNYGYLPVEGDVKSELCRCGEWHSHEVEVPPEVVALWDTIARAADEVQRQLCSLDNDWYEKHEQIIKDRCRRDGHARDMDGTCHYCGEAVSE